MENSKMLERNLEYLDKYYVGKILVCKLSNGRVFSAMLVAVNPNGTLLFETSLGHLMTDRIEDIVEITEFVKKFPRTTSLDEGV